MHSGQRRFVSLWHCDALGIYSGFEEQSTGGGGTGSGAPEDPAAGSGGQQGGAPPAAQGGSGGSNSEATPTDDEIYLRGEQVTNADGVVEFTTIYPGWYTSRAVHAHLKVFVDSKTAVTSQLFFDEDVTDDVYTTAPYNTKGERDTRIDSDNVYSQADAESTPLLVTLKRNGDEMLAAGNIVIAT